MKRDKGEYIMASKNTIDDFKDRMTAPVIMWDIEKNSEENKTDGKPASTTKEGDKEEK